MSTDDYDSELTEEQQNNLQLHNSGDYDDAVRLSLISDPGRPSVDLQRIEASKSSEIDCARPIISSTENLLRPSHQTMS